MSIEQCFPLQPLAVSAQIEAFFEFYIRKPSDTQSTVRSEEGRLPLEDRHRKCERHMLAAAAPLRSPVGTGSVVPREVGSFVLLYAIRVRHRRTLKMIPTSRRFLPDISGRINGIWK
jgi:hypothetical protein